MKRALPVAAVVVIAAAVWIVRATNPETHSPASRTSHSTQRNVVLITIDTLRADRVGRGLTPNIDKLAARGLAFANARTTAPLTLPAHTSIMTGLRPPEHGVRENGIPFDRKSPTLARAFQDAGYQTAAFVGAYVLNRRFGLDEGFQTFDDAVRRDPSRAEQLEAERPGAEVVDATLTWLDTASIRFFVWVHLYDPHFPYVPPDESLKRANGNAYDGEVAYADAQVGRLLEWLDAKGLSSSTVVALTGDHGESLGDHGEMTHGMLVYESALRVPLIIAAGPSGREARPVSLTSLGARLLAAAGVAAPTFREPTDVYAESVYPRRLGWHQLGVLVEDNWKLILSSERELYDLRSDPGERNNLASSYGSRVEAMAGALARLQHSAKPAGKVAPEAAERLRALGYVSGSTPTATADSKAPNPARTIGAWTAFERASGQLQDRPAAALPQLRELATRHPDAQLFRTTYAQALKDSGRAPDAVVVYKEAVRRWPADPVLFHDLAVAAREAGDFGEAMRAEQASLALDPTSAMAQNGLGLLHADAGRAADAAAAFERAARADPTNPSYVTNLGNARRAMNDSQGAESAYRKALEIDADFGDALNGLGAMLVQAARPAEAVPLFERAVRRDPELHEARLNLGIAYQQAGNTQKAAEIYREVLKMTPPRFARERAAAEALLKAIQ